MKDLIERLEKAAGPDRELDCQLAFAVGFDHAETEWRHWADQAIKAGDELIQWVGTEHVPRYTTSIDAALTLVPAHHLWELRQGFEARAIIWMIEVDYDDKPVPTGYSTTFPAIALCIAALKARKDALRP